MSRETENERATTTLKMAIRSTPIGRHYSLPRAVPLQQHDAHFISRRRRRRRRRQRWSCCSCYSRSISLIAINRPFPSLHHTRPYKTTPLFMNPAHARKHTHHIQPPPRAGTLRNLMNLTLDLAIINPRFN